MVRLLLARKGVEVNKSAANGATALYMASRKGHVEVVRLLIAGPNQHSQSHNASERPPVRSVALRGREAVARLAQLEERASAGRAQSTKRSSHG